MSRTGSLLHESVHSAGLSAHEAREIVVRALADDDEYEFVELNSLSYQLVRSFRPMWAVVAGIATSVFLGLGLLFLLVRRIETCTITVVDGSRGAVLTVSGPLLPGRLAALTEALDHRRAANAEAGTFGLRVPELPAQAPGQLAARGSQLDEDTHYRAAVPLAEVLVSPAPCRFELRFDDGEVRALEATIVIGRDPTASIVAADARPLVLDDAQVSKAHASVGVDHSGAWVEDLHSTNGTFVVPPGAARVTVVSGQRHRLEPGAVIQLGSRYVTLTSAD